MEGAPQPGSPQQPGTPEQTSAPEQPRPRRMLYRCGTPTNFLCPCGAVERRLRKLGLEHGTERVARLRARRPEVHELTRQDRVPVLVDGEEVIHDSRRILQYLDWAYGEGE